jgi:hypothetical protein
MNLKAILPRLNTAKDHNDSSRSVQVDAPKQNLPGSPVTDRWLEKGPSQSETPL